MANDHVRPVIANRDDEYQLSRITAVNEIDVFYPIRYVYDYLLQHLNWLNHNLSLHLALSPMPWRKNHHCPKATPG